MCLALHENGLGLTELIIIGWDTWLCIVEDTLTHTNFWGKSSYFKAFS